ncbi:hypothetical protein SRHO_G00186050 [Serrasalmus rhombeus]
MHPDQTCAIPGQRITDSLILIRDTICLARDRNIRLIVLNLDFEKAFDRVSHQYLFQVLQKMGFSRRFLRTACPVPGLTEAQVEEVWRNAAHPALRNTHKDLSWLVAHEALPARAVMHSRGMVKNPICPRLGCGAPETVRHMLWECSAARDLWLRTSALWCPYLPAGGPQTLVYRQAVNGVGWSRALPPATFRELWPILNSVKDAIWESRNLLVGKRVEVSLQAKVKMVEKAVQEYTRRASRRRALGPQARKVEGAIVPGCPQMHPTTLGWSSGAAV